ncbi:MAG: RNA chaperone Hfq [Sulfobacillus sp.]
MADHKGQWVEVPQYQRPGKARVPSTKPRNPSGAPRQAQTPAGRHSQAQEALYRDWLAQQTVLEVMFSDGAAIVGTLTDYDTYALTIASDGQPRLVFKSAVRWMRAIPADG